MAKKKKEAPKWWRLRPGLFKLGDTGYAVCSKKAWGHHRDSRREAPDLPGDVRRRDLWLLDENGEPYPYCSIFGMVGDGPRTGEPINGWRTLPAAKKQCEELVPLLDELR